MEGMRKGFCSFGMLITGGVIQPGTLKNVPGYLGRGVPDVIQVAHESQAHRAGTFRLAVTWSDVDFRFQLPLVE